MKFYIVDTKSCNIFKYKNIFTKLELDFEIIDKPINTTPNDFLILPGVGNFGFFAKSIERNNLKQMILDHINNKYLILGICVGMQYFLNSSEEDASVKGLGVINGEVKKISELNKIPIIGNFKLSSQKNNKEEYITLNDKFFFMHSYYCQINQKADCIYYNTIKKFKYISSFRISNILGVQFHPELSNKNGINFFKIISRLKCV